MVVSNIGIMLTSNSEIGNMFTSKKLGKMIYQVDLHIFSQMGGSKKIEEIPCMGSFSEFGESFFLQPQKFRSVKYY